MRLFRKNLAGKAYIALNVIRACNIICLLSAIAASFVMLIKTFVVSKFFFFDGVSHVIEGFIASKSRIFHSFLPTLAYINRSGSSHNRDSPLQALHCQQLATPLTEIRIRHPWCHNDHRRCFHSRKPQQGSYVSEVTWYADVAYRDCGWDLD